MNLSLLHRLYLPLLLGLIARLTSSIVGLGFHARDDYYHLLAPALAWLENPEFDWLASDLPAAGARGFLAPKIIYGLLSVFKNLGMDDPENLLRALHAALGTYSLLAVICVYLLVDKLTENPKTTAIATWLAALHFVMPYAGTRLLIEAMAIPPLLYGLYLVSHHTRGKIIWGGFFIAVSCWFRFQVGVAALGVALALFWNAHRNQDVPKGREQVLALALGGGVGVLVQGLFDYATTNQFLGPVIENFRLNLNPHDELSHSGLLTYVGFFAILTIPPFTLVIAKPLWSAVKRYTLVSFPLLAFVFVHSLIGHKEERFMLPALPLFLILLALAVQMIDENPQFSNGMIGREFKRWIKPVLLLHGVLLVVICMGQSQKNLRESMGWVQARPEVVNLISLGPETHTFFLGRKGINIQRKRLFYPEWLHWTMFEMRERTHKDIYVLSYERDRQKAGDMFVADNWQCEVVSTQTGWWADRLAYKLNAKHNVRRSPILIWRCFFSQSA
jgi:hypothetical protein